MINDINYFINNEERRILKQAIEEIGTNGTVVVCKKMDNSDQTFSEKIVINHNQKIITIKGEDSLFNKLALDRVYEVNTESI